MAKSHLEMLCYLRRLYRMLSLGKTEAESVANWLRANDQKCDPGLLIPRLKLFKIS